MTPADWLEIVVPTAVAAADEVAAELIDRVPAAAAGAEVRGDQVVFWVAVPQGEQALADARAAARQLSERGLPVAADRVEARPAAPESEWRDAWKKYFTVTRITRQLVIVPSWETYDPAPGDLVIHLDPGQAFGTGAHATTKLVLESLQALADGGAAPARALDVGAGSGILSIAAALLWPELEAVAVDNDPLAVDACRENAQANRLGDRIACSADDVSTVEGDFELVLANIQADVLRALRPAIAARVAHGGTLILSGILAGQAEGVAEEYEAAGLETVETARDGEGTDWYRVVLRRPER